MTKQSSTSPRQPSRLHERLAPRSSMVMEQFGLILPFGAPDFGDRKFQENCSRCHTAPEQTSSHMVGTVVPHMRVRTSLSVEDEKDILRFLAPDFLSSSLHCNLPQ